MQLAPIASDPTLVPGLTLPRLPGLPGPMDAGIALRDILGPPTPDSLAGRADMFAVKTAQRLRTPQGDAWAQNLARTGDFQVWRDFASRIRSRTGVAQGWLGTALLAADLGANALVTYAAKSTYNRPRPFQADSSIVALGPIPHGSSYPSGHASAAFAAARIIARLDPTLANEAYNVATQVAVSRVYCGVHYPSDVVTGALLGTGVAEALLHTLGRVLPKK